MPFSNLTQLIDIERYRPIHARISFQLRGEAYNAFNHADMGDPCVAVTSSAFGSGRV